MGWGIRAGWPPAAALHSERGHAWAGLTCSSAASLTPQALAPMVPATLTAHHGLRALCRLPSQGRCRCGLTHFKPTHASLLVKLA